MDQLTVYRSDSEENDEDGKKDEIQLDFKNETYIRVHKLQTCSDHKHVNTEGNLGLELSQNTEINYFGISSCDTQITPKIAVSGEYEKKQRYISVHGQLVEVPEGDFWGEFTEAEIPSIEKITKAHKRKVESPVRQHDAFKKQAVNTAITERYQQSDVKSNTHCLSYYPDKSSKLNFLDDNQAKYHSSLMAGSTQSAFMAKIYTVHPKISQYLNRHLGNHCASKELKHWAGHAGVINRIMWCSVPSFSHLIMSASSDSTVRIWNAWAQQEACVQTLTVHTKAVRDAQWSHDGRQVLSCSYDRTAAVTDVQTGQCQMQLEHDSYVSVGRFHPVIPHLLATGAIDNIQVWDTRHPEIPIRVFKYKEHIGQVQDLMFSHDGQDLFSCGDVVTRESSDRSILAWDFQTGVILSNQIFQERYIVNRLYLHSSQSQFLAQTQAGYIAIFSTQRPYKMNKNKRFEGHKNDGYNVGLTVSQDGSLVYSGSSDGRLYCYNFNNGRKIRTINYGGALLDVTAHPVLPSVVAGATWDGDIVLFQ